MTSRHTWYLKRLAREPWRVGIENALDVRIEHPIRRESGEMLSDIDLLIRTDSRIIVLEYKSGDSAPYAFQRYLDALQQLSRMSDCFSDRLGVRPCLIYAYGPNFAYEIIDDGSPFSDLGIEQIIHALDPRGSR